MRKLLTGLLFASLLSATSAQAVLIDFEQFNNGDLIGTVGNATFTSNNNVQVYAFGGAYAQSGVNTIAPDAGGGLFNGDLFVDFALAVNNLSFWSGGDNDNGLQATIRVFVNGVFNSAVCLLGDGNAATTDFHNLSAFANVSRIEIVNVTDRAGLVYDDFSFDIAAVPEPATLGLFGLSLVGLGFMSRRRRLR